MRMTDTNGRVISFFHGSMSEDSPLFCWIVLYPLLPPSLDKEAYPAIRWSNGGIKTVHITFIPMVLE